MEILLIVPDAEPVAPLEAAARAAFAQAAIKRVTLPQIDAAQGVAPSTLLLMAGPGKGKDLGAKLADWRRLCSECPLVVHLPSARGEAEALEAGADEVLVGELRSGALAHAVERARARRVAAIRVARTMEREAESARQARLRRHNELLHTLAAQFKADDLPTQLLAIAGAAARSLEVCRVGIWLFDAEGDSLRCEQLYDARTLQAEAGAELWRSDHERYFEAIESERVIVANDAHQHAATRSFAPTYLARNNIRSMLNAPVRAGGRLLGVICHEQTSHLRAFTDEDQSLAGSFGDLVALAIEAHEHRKAEQALRSSNAQLEDARRIEAVGRLAGGVAHDFNNVITVVSSYAFLLSKKLDKHDALQGPIAEIGKAAERAADITRKLLALSRRDPVAPRVFDLNVTLRGMETFLRRLIGEHIELSFELSDEPMLIRADPGQIEQIVLNLIVNARDAAQPEGSKVVLRTSCNPEDSSERPLVLEVSDTGVGMSTEVQSRIFEPFFTTKEVGRGSGLGLFTVWGVVNQMDGVIEVQSAPMKGTRFILRFAGATPDAESVVAPLERERLIGSERVLLVEDEAQVRDVTALILRDFGYRVIAAGDIDEAMAKAKENSDIDLLVSDIVMPKASGPVVAARLRELIPSLRILFISGYNKDMLSAYDASLGPTLAKPFTAEQIGLKIREVLDGHESAAQ